MLSKEIEKQLNSFGFKQVFLEDDTYWYQKLVKVPGIWLKIYVEEYKEKPIYVVEVKTLDTDEVEGDSNAVFNGAYLEKGKWGLGKFKQLQKKYNF